MNRSFIHAPRQWLIAAALAGLGGAALAQNAAPASTPAPGASAVAPSAARQSPRLTPQQWHERMTAQHAQHLAALEAALAITPDQAQAWSQFEAAMQPPAPQQPPQPDEWAKLTTPERIDLMQQRTDAQQQRIRQTGDAVKAFYAQLTPAQQKTFDERTAHPVPQGERGPLGTQVGAHGGPHRSPHGKPGKAASAPAPAASQAR